MGRIALIIVRRRTVVQIAAVLPFTFQCGQAVLIMVRRAKAVRQAQQC